MVNSNSPNPFDILLEKFREVVREEIRIEVTAALANGKKGEAPKTDWLRAEELADIYNLPRSWFEHRGRDGDIMRSKPGRYVLFFRPDVDRYLMKHKSGGDDKKSN